MHISARNVSTDAQSILVSSISGAMLQHSIPRDHFALAHVSFACHAVAVFFAYCFSGRRANRLHVTENDVKNRLSSPDTAQNVICGEKRDRLTHSRRSAKIRNKAKPLINTITHFAEHILQPLRFSHGTIVRRLTDIMCLVRHRLRQRHKESFERNGVTR